MVSGVVVSAVDGTPLPGATLRAGEAAVVTDAAGMFRLEAINPSVISVVKPAWTDQVVDWDGQANLRVELEPFVVRALRASAGVVSDPQKFAELLALTKGTTVNALVFDTKDEADRVLYRTEVEFAYQLGRVDEVYDPVELLSRAKGAGLYTITRIVTFEDPIWARAVPEAKLAGAWVDAADPANWLYPIALAVEACSLGFDEIQFDYVRFPSGRTAGRAAGLVPQTEAERVAAISGFLAAAAAELHPMGCALSAAIFGIVLSSVDDQRLGQTPEAISGVTDAISPMLYPSHYDSGWLGLENPNSHPAFVVGNALDSGIPRMAPGSQMRPWIQGFYYNAGQVLAQIAEAERVNAGWIIWNALGNYDRSWLPVFEDSEPEG